MVDKNEVVEVHYPHNRHRLAGRWSNHTKEYVLAEFLDFVHNNSQPNGRQEGSSSAYFFLSQFTRIVGPAEGGNFEDKCKSSVVVQFNRAQLEKGRPTCSNTAAKGMASKAQAESSVPPLHDRLLRYMQVSSSYATRRIERAQKHCNKGKGISQGIYRKT